MKLNRPNLCTLIVACLAVVGCDETVLVKPRQLGAPPTKEDNAWGTASYEGRPGEQRLEWTYWRHHWVAEFSGERGTFVRLPDQTDERQNASGPGMAESQSVHPAWDKACETAQGHLMCHDARAGILIGVIEQRVGRVCLATSTDNGATFKFTDLGPNEFEINHGTYSTFTSLEKCATLIDEQGSAMVVLAWERVVDIRHAAPGTDTSKLPAETRDGWKVETLLIKDNEVQRQPLADWSPDQFVSTIRLSHARGRFWAAITGREVWAWNIDRAGKTSPLRRLPDSKSTSLALIVAHGDGAFVTWGDSRKSYRVGFPGPWELPRSKHTQIAVCEIRPDKVGPTILITPPDHCASLLAAGGTPEGPSLCWSLRRIDPDEVTKFDKNDPTRIQEYTHRASK
jgi:hypothetical protein